MSTLDLLWLVGTFTAGLAVVCAVVALIAWFRLDDDGS